MIDKFAKITVGFVRQAFEKNADGQFVCTDQVFIAGDECGYEDMAGNPLKEVPEHEYQPYEMVSPRNKEQNVKIPSLQRCTWLARK